MDDAELISRLKMVALTTGRMTHGIGEPKQAKKFRACDQCELFDVWTGNVDEMPINHNPCIQGNKMAFRMPSSPTDTEWGFYRLRCKDFTPTQEKVG